MNGNQDIAVPSLIDLLNVDGALPDCVCPACEEKERQLQRIYYDVRLDQAVHDYVLGAPFEVLGAVPQKPKCALCQQDIVYKRRTKQHADDEESSDQLDFSTDYCVYCQRYCCEKCRGNDFFKEKYGCPFMFELSTVDGAYVERYYQNLRSSVVSTLNQTELKFLLSRRSVREVWDGFQRELGEHYVLPLRICAGADRYVDAQTRCCARCLGHALSAAMHYARAALRDDRPVCLCGSGCYLQHLSSEHQQQCQHFGRGTRGDQAQLSIWG